MKKLSEILLLILTNIFIFLLLLFISDVIIFNLFSKIYEKKDYSPEHKFGYYYIYPGFIYDLKNYFNGISNLYGGRKPDGLEYKNKTPIVVFGCSYAFGQYLNYNQTFSYKLAHLLKRPVYNRAFPGGGIQYMYFQVVDYGNKDFFNDIQDLDTVIYIMISDHYRRLMSNYFAVSDPYLFPTYSYKNGKFKMNNNNFINLINSSYTLKYLNKFYADKYYINPKHSELLTDIAVKYFELSRNKLEEHYNKPIKFYILLYDCWKISHNELLIKKLNDKGFIVISTDDLTNEDLLSPKYMMLDNCHPTEAAWDLLTPLIAEKIKSKD